MPQPKVSIKWPSKAEVKRRIAGLQEIRSRVVQSRPEPFYGKMDYKTNKWQVKPKSWTPRGKKWREMNTALVQLINEAEDLLKLIPSKNRAKKEAQSGAA